MKTLFTLILCTLLSATSIAQEKNIETKSVSLENLITFIVENYSISKSKTNEKKNITFLIQLSNSSLNNEESILLKQSFKLLSKRLQDDDRISIIGYSALNGVALKKASPKDLKSVLHAIDNFESSIKELHTDGIALAYDFAEKNFNDKAINTVVMVRNPNASPIENTLASSATVATSKKKNNAVLITAISLLPELIAIIKD